MNNRQARWHVSIEFEDPDSRRIDTYTYVVQAQTIDMARQGAKEQFFTAEGRTLPIARGRWSYKNVVRV